MESLNFGAVPSMNWEVDSLEQSWKTFKNHVKFVFSGPLKEKSEEEKCSYLMIWVGEKGREIYSTWNLSEEEQKVIKNYYDKFENYVKPRTNLIYNRYKFQSKIQQEDTFEQFCTSLQVLVKDCDYDKPEEMVRDRIVFGVKSSKVREKLINVGSKLTFAQSVDIVRAYESSKDQCQQMQKEDKTVNVVKSKRHSKPSSQRPQRQENQRCGNCGYVHPKGSCPAKGKTCHKCLKSDHFSSVCKSTKPDPKKRNRKGKVHTLDYDSSQEEYCGMLTEWPVNIIDDDWTVQSQINNKPIVMQIDTGAKCNVISKNVLNKTGIKTALSKPQATLTSYSGHKIRPLGAVQLDCTIKGQTFPIQFHVVDIKALTVLRAIIMCAVWTY